MHTPCFLEAEQGQITSVESATRTSRYKLGSRVLPAMSCFTYVFILPPTPHGIGVNVCSSDYKVTCCIIAIIMFGVLSTLFGEGTQVFRVGLFFPAKLVWGTNFSLKIFVLGLFFRTIWFRNHLLPQNEIIVVRWVSFY